MGETQGVQRQSSEREPYKNGTSHRVRNSPVGRKACPAGVCSAFGRRTRVTRAGDGHLWEGWALLLLGHPVYSPKVLVSQLWKAGRELKVTQHHSFNKPCPKMCKGSGGNEGTAYTGTCE